MLTATKSTPIKMDVKMPRKKSAVSAQKPLPLFKRPLSLNLSGLAVAIAKGAGHALTGRFEELSDDSVDALAAIGLDGKEPEWLVYSLMERSLQSAVASLLADSKDQIAATLDTSFLTPLLEKHIAVVEINVDFFESPNRLPVINAISEAVAEWLIISEVDASKAQTIVSRLPGYFPFALHKEWQSGASHYEAIRTELISPFLNAVEKEAAWDIYHAQLQRRLEESLFGEPFGLRQIYIPLNAYYETKPTKSEMSKEGRPKQRVAVKLLEELDQWMASSNKDDAVRAVSGGPGSGKSSFAKIYAAHIASQNKINVLFVPLHFIDPTRDFVEEIGRFVRDEGILKANPLLKEGRTYQLFIILDGLDELASQGRAAATTARNFIRSVQQTVDRVNMQSLNIRVMFSGREVVMQDSESEFRQARQVLTILPYFNEQAALRHPEHSEYEDPQSLLSTDLRQSWWSNYGKLTGLGYDGVPGELDRPDLAEITAQPLLNYLLALSYCRGKLNFSTGVNLNQIYDDLVQAVYERGYENGRKTESIRRLDCSDFFLILEEIGLAAWHGDGRTTTVSEIETYCRAGGFGDQLDAFQDGAKIGITSLLAAFFFRQHGTRPQGDPTFVFTHKSFGEYLAARRIVRAMTDILEEKNRRETIGRNRGRGWSDIDALAHWGEICGPTAISKNIHSFLRSEVQLLSINETRQAQVCFTALFNHVLRFGIPTERLTKIATFQDALHQSRNAEESLLAALNACALVTCKISEIDNSDSLAFGSWFKRIQKQRSGPESVVAASCLSWLNLTGVNLDFTDLYGANISNSTLDNVQGYRIVLGHANCHGASLKEANLEEAYFLLSNLEQADFRGASLTEAAFRHSRCINTNFSSAKLGRADFRNSELDGAIFEDALTEGTDFRKTVRQKSRKVRSKSEKVDSEL